MSDACLWVSPIGQMTLSNGMAEGFVHVLSFMCTAVNNIYVIAV